PSGSAASSSSPRTGLASGRRTGTTCTATRGRKSVSGATERSFPRRLRIRRRRLRRPARCAATRGRRDGLLVGGGSLPGLPAALLPPFPQLLAQLLRLVALLGRQDLLHVELHQRQLRLQLRPGRLPRRDRRLDLLAVDLVGAHRLLIRELLLLEVGLQVD